MKIIVMMAVRNEEWILGFSARVALLWADELIILDHASNDKSNDIAQKLSCDGRVSLLHEPDKNWKEMEQRDAMLRWARDQRGATHVCITDADEVLTSNLLPTIREHIANTPPNRILQLPLYYLRGSTYHTNGLWGQRWGSFAFQDSPELHWGGDTYHAREPQGRRLIPCNPIEQGHGGILHFWGSSERRLIAKHALYQITETLHWPDKSLEEIRKMYSLWRSPEDSRAMWPHKRDFHVPWTFAELPPSWLTGYGALMRDHYFQDKEPWQEAEIRRAVAEFGPERFAGLDLFGIA